MKRITFLIPALILLMFAGSTSIAQALEEGDSGYPGRFRVVHSAPGGPPVNVMVNGSVLHGPMWYGQTSPYISLSPAVYNIKVITADRHQTPVYNWDRWINAGQSETIIITGDAEKNDYILLEDDASLPANPENGRIKFFNASPDAGLVDVVAIQNGSEDVWFSFVGFKENRDYKEVDSGIYDIEIRNAITNDVLLEILGEQIPANSVSSLMLTGLVEGEPELNYVFEVEDGAYMQPPMSCSSCPPVPCMHCLPLHHYRTWGFPHSPNFPYDRSHIYPWLGPYPHYSPWVYKYDIAPYHW